MNPVSCILHPASCILIFFILFPFSSYGAEVLLTGFCGPNAFKALNAGKVAVSNDAAGTVREAVRAYLGGNLQHSDSANVEGHW